MDVRKLKDKATEAFTKGKFARAGEAYAEYCAADPKDLQARLRMGDAWAKCGQKEKAISAYSWAAEGFAKEGFLPRAIAASKLILELDPAHKGVQKMLADLYARKSAPGAVKRPTSANPLPAARPDAIDLPPDTVPGIESDIASAPPSSGPSPMNNPDAIDIEMSLPGNTRPKPQLEVTLDLDASAESKDVAPEPEPIPEEIEIELSLPGNRIKPSAPPSENAPKAYELEVDDEPTQPSAAALTETDDSVELFSDEPVKPEVVEKTESAPVKVFSLDDDVPEPVAVVPPPPSDTALPAPHPTPSIIVAPEAYQTPAAAPPPAVEPVEAPAPVFTLDERDVDEAAHAPPPPASHDVVPGGAPNAPPVFSLDDADEKKVPVIAPPPSAPDPEPAAFSLDENVGEVPLPVPSAPRPAEPVYQLDDDEPQPLTKMTLRMKSKSLEVDLDPDELAAELGFTDKPLPAPTPSSLPPGLKAKPLPPPPSDVVFVPPPAMPAEVRGWTTSTAAPAVAGRGGLTDLEKSLDIFSQFDADAVAAPPAIAPVVPPSGSGESLLHAVDAAAAVAPSSAEEKMEAPEEARPDTGALPKIPLFSDLPPEAFIALFERCPLRRCEPGDVMIRQGSHGDSFFVICAGSVKVYRMEGETRRDIATLPEGAFFGEMALLSDAPRTASVEAAAEDTQLLEISAAVLAELSKQHPTVATALKKFCRQRLLTNLMGSSALFAPFSRTDRRQLVEKFRARDVPKGEVLIREGTRSDGMYIILSGEIEVRVGAAAVATLKEGDIFGEMSLLTKAAATATCAAARRTSLLRLPREDFDQLILSHPQILVLVSDLTDERKKQNAALASRASTTAADATPMV